MDARWETYTEIRAASVAAGFPVSPHQLRRWRGMGLLPEIRQAGNGRPTGGSNTRHPLGTAEQAIAIRRFLNKKEKLAGMGWKLWLCGFPVREAHWRIPLENAQATLREISEIVRAAVRRDERRDTGQTIYDLVDIKVLEGTPLYAAMMKLPDALRSAALRVAADVLLGRFKADGASGKPFDPKEITAIDKAIGLSGDLPRVSGQSLNFDELPHILEKISTAINNLSRNINRIEEPLIAVRRDLLNAQMIAIDLYHSTKWLFKGGFNLRIAERIFAKASFANQAFMLLVWNRYLANDPDTKNSADITEMARATAESRELADWLQQAIAGLPKGHPLLNMPKLRRAIAKPGSFDKFVKSVS